MKKVILNKSYGGFDVSRDAYQRYADKVGLQLFVYDVDFVHEDGKIRTYFVKEDNIKVVGSVFVKYATKDFGERIPAAQIDDAFILSLDESHREDATLIEVVEELCEKASGKYGDLRVVEIPDDVAKDYVIDNYDGIETLHKRVQEW